MSDLELIRGDDRTFSVAVKVSPEPDAEPLNIAAATALTFTVKRRTTDATVVLVKTLGAGVTITNGALGLAQIALAAADTDNLAGTYRWDLEYRNASGARSTVARGALIVRADITGVAAEDLEGVGGLLTVAELREHGAWPLSDGRLRDVLDAAEADIEAVLGPAGSQAVTLYPTASLTRLPVRAVEITGIAESLAGNVTELEDGDYVLAGGGWWLERLFTGPNAGLGYRWGHSIVVSLVPADDVATRKRAQLALALLELNREPGARSLQLGSWSESQGGDLTYETERAAILNALRPADPLGFS